MYVQTYVTGLTWDWRKVKDVIIRSSAWRLLFICDAHTHVKLKSRWLKVCVSCLCSERESKKGLKRFKVSNCLHELFVTTASDRVGKWASSGSSSTVTSPPLPRGSPASLPLHHIQMFSPVPRHLMQTQKVPFSINVPGCKVTPM